MEYNISTGSGLIIISSKKNLKEHASIQAITSGTNAEIELKLKQSNQSDFADGGHDLPEIPILADAGSFSNLLQTNQFYCDYIAVYIDVKTATVGTVTILTNYKD